MVTRSGAKWGAMILVVVALAGCAGDSQEAPPTSASAAAPTETDDPTRTDAEQKPVTANRYLTTDRRLALEPPAAGSATQGLWADSYAQGTLSMDEFSWSADHLKTATLVGHGTYHATVWISADAPVAPAGTSLLGIAVLGSTKAFPLMDTAEGPQGPLVPGTPYKYEFEVKLEAPRVPIVVPAAEGFRFAVGFVGGSSDQTPIRILVGGDHASFVEFTYERLVQDPLANASAPTTTTKTGTFDAASPMPQDYPMSIDASATFLEVRLKPTGGRPLDLDLALLSSNGEVVSDSLTPGTTESLYLAGPALDGLRGTDAKVRVTQAGGAQSVYEVTFIQG